MIGGGVAGAGEVLFAPLRRALRDYATLSFVQRLEVAPAADGHRTPVWWVRPPPPRSAVHGGGRQRLVQQPILRSAQSAWSESTPSPPSVTTRRTTFAPLTSAEIGWAGMALVRTVRRRDLRSRPPRSRRRPCRFALVLVVHADLRGDGGAPAAGVVLDGARGVHTQALGEAHRVGDQLAVRVALRQRPAVVEIDVLVSGVLEPLLDEDIGDALDHRLVELGPAVGGVPVVEPHRRGEGEPVSRAAAPAGAGSAGGGGAPGRRPECQSCRAEQRGGQRSDDSSGG